MISCSAGGSGAIAAFITSPLDLAKLRMQIGTSNLGMIGSLRSIYYREGISGLFKGAGARVSHSFCLSNLNLSIYIVYNRYECF
jgi:hypothetical protein